MSARRSGSDESTIIGLVEDAFSSEVGSLQRRLLGGDEVLAGEAWNALLLEIWQKLGQYDEAKSALRTWVYNLAKYQALTLARKRERNQHAELDPNAVVDADTSDDLGDLLSQGEIRELRSAFRRLSPTQRQLLWYRYVEGWLPSEIVDRNLVEGVSDQTVRVYILRAKERLALLLAREAGHIEDNPMTEVR